MYDKTVTIYSSLLQKGQIIVYKLNMATIKLVLSQQQCLIYQNHQLIVTMGNSKAKSDDINEISLTDRNTHKDNNVIVKFPQQQQDEQCFCCYSPSKRQIKEKWIESILDNCRKVRAIEPWSQTCISLFQNRKFSVVNFKKQVSVLLHLKDWQINENILQKIDKATKAKDKQIQIQQLKNNLKNCIISTRSDLSKSRTFRDTIIKNNKLIKVKQKQLQNLSKIARGSSRIETFRQSMLVLENRNTKKESSSLRESLLSFLDDTINNFICKDKQNINQTKSLTLITQFAITLQNHLNSPAHPLSLLKKIFYEYFYHQSTILNSRQIEQKKVTQSIQSIKHFLIILQQAVYNLYDLQQYGQSQMSQNDQNSILSVINYQNLETIITAIVFKDKTFYRNTFQLIKSMNRKKQQIYEQMIQKSRLVRPQDFQVKKEYCLRKNSSTTGSQSLSKKLQSMTLCQNQQLINIPYQNCITSLKQIINAKSPMSKMRIVMECADKITQSISKHYGQSSESMKNLVLDADQVLSIFCYIIVRSQIKHLHSHLYLIQHFSTDHELISATGYYFSVLTCALQQLQSQSDKKQ